MVGCTVPSLRNLSRLPPPSHPHWWIGIQGLMRVKKHHQAHISTGHFQGALACGGEAQEMSNQWWVGAALSDSFSPEVETISCEGLLAYLSWNARTPYSSCRSQPGDLFLSDEPGLACIFKYLCFTFPRPLNLNHCL